MVSILYFFTFFSACVLLATGTPPFVNEVSPQVSQEVYTEQECNSSSKGKLQVSVENDFLFEKVVGMKEQIRIYSETFLEYEALTTKLTDLNSQVVAENSELKGQFDALNVVIKELETTISRMQLSSNSNDSNTVLHETIRSLSVYAGELEKEVSWLQMENEDLQRTMDLLPLVCLSFNVVVLVFAFSEHFSFLFNPCEKFITILQNSITFVLLDLFGKSTISDYSSQVSSISQFPDNLVFRLDVLRQYALDIYQTTVTTLTRAIVIAAS